MVMKLSLHLFTAANATAHLSICTNYTKLLRMNFINAGSERKHVIVFLDRWLWDCVLYCFDLILGFERKRSLRYIGWLQNTNKQQGIVIFSEIDATPKSHWLEG